MKLYEHHLPTYDVKLVGTEAEVLRYRRDVAEMAQLLLELQHVDTSDGEYKEVCPVCFNRERLASDGGIGIPVKDHWPHHAPDCKLVAVLRAAGVLPES